MISGAMENKVRGIREGITMASCKMPAVSVLRYIHSRFGKADVADAVLQRKIGR